MTQLSELNRYLNRWPYKEDIENYGVPDYWASPLQFLRKSGDCEDYSIIKFVSLRRLGYPNNRLRIVVVIDTLRNVRHAVLVVEVKDKFYVMDSLYDAVLTDKSITYYLPQYAVNETTRWAYVFVPPAPIVAIPSLTRKGLTP